MLQIIDIIEISCGPHAHAYAAKQDDERINIAERRMQENTREARMRSRQEQISFLEAFSNEEGVLYGPRIDNSF